MKTFWKVYEATLKLFRYNQGDRGTFFYSKEHAAHYKNTNRKLGANLISKNLCKLDNGKIVAYTTWSSSFKNKTESEFDGYFLLGRGKYLRDQGDW